MGRGISGRALAGWGLTAAFLSTLGFAAYAKPTAKAARPKTTTAPSASGIAGLSRADTAALETRFAKEIWPLMSRADAGCTSCHAVKNASQFLMLTDARGAFQKMLVEGHFDPANRASVVERITTTDKNIKMPPVGMKQWTPQEAALLTAFAEDVQKKRTASVGKPDEMFPFHLLNRYTGKRPAEGLDNTFLSYRQLKAKVLAIFGDDWRRDDRDLFLENLHLFGGADFVRRFDETTKASPTFLTGVEMMARDVASRAYLSRSGPFANWPASLPSPAAMKAPDAAYTRTIDQLYRKMLFRPATAAERRDAFTFLQSVYRAQSSLAATAPQDLRFSLTVSDQQGRKTTQDITIRVTADDHALYQEFVNQNQTSGADEKTAIASKTLGGTFTFAPGDTGQKVEISNIGTQGNVSVSGIVLRGPLPSHDEKAVPVTDPTVRPEGAWRIRTDNGITSYEDNNENKGQSLVSFPVTVTKAGRYEVAISWRAFRPAPEGKRRGQRGAPAEAAENVRVEVTSRDKTSRLAIPAAPPVPPKGEAHFFIDQTIDNIAFWDLKTAFRFDEGDGIEIRNNGTRKRVVADAIRLHRYDDGDAASTLLLRGADAVGKEKWAAFAAGTFKPYNTTGPELFQDTDEKGKRPDLSLLYKPASARREGWNQAAFYRVAVGFPGQANNEPRVPIVVKAQASSPIVQVVFPEHAHVGAAITIDASSTFNLQHSALRFRWTQVGGPRVALADPTARRLRFAAPRMTAQQAAWEGLCRALLAHPDFLFTRPRSLASLTDSRQRRRLQLVKIAQDLVGRTPSATELARLDRGASLGQMVDSYLSSKAFQDFYFHRTRLYLESHGTESQDEPARLWTYIAIKDRPFKEILTADYTVDTKFRKQARPAYHGRTGLLTMKGFVQGKPGLPHFNYPAQVTEKFLGYIFEVPAEVVEAREGITAAGTTDPQSLCYSCHKVLTPLAYQRGFWDDDGNYREHDDTGLRIDDSDRQLVASYPYRGNGMQAFAVQAQNKERFIRTILQTHFVWYFGREMRYETDERGLYKRLWDVAAKRRYALRPLIKAIVLSPEYLNGPQQTPPPDNRQKLARRERLAQFHEKIPGYGAAFVAARRREAK